MLGKGRCVLWYGLGRKPISFSIGVSGDSGSSMDVSSSNSEASSKSLSRKDWFKSVLCERFVVWLSDNRGGLFSLSYSRSEWVVTPSLDGKPNSIASSNF